MASSTSECGCTGIRRCLLCEPLTPQKGPVDVSSSFGGPVALCCPDCGGVGKEGDFEREISSEDEDWLPRCRGCAKCHRKSRWFSIARSDVASAVAGGRSFCVCCRLEGDFGVQLFRDIVTPEQESRILEQIDNHTWVVSQSGRRKQDFGPSVNFKKHRIKLDNFRGLPGFAWDNFVPLWTEKGGPLSEALRGFRAVELCNLEYTPQRGSAIDPHYDDEWLWGERLVTFNLSSPTRLSFICPQCRASLRVPIPRRSAVVFYGPSRHDWLHAVAREDVKSRRVAVTLRELSPTFLEGGTHEDVGAKILDIAGRRHPLWP